MAIATINPATGQTIKTFEPLTDSQVDQKIARAAEVFPGFHRLPFAARARMMVKAAEILESEKASLGRLMTTEMGKTLRWLEAKPSSAPGPAATMPNMRNGSSPMNPLRRRQAAVSFVTNRLVSSWS